MEDRVHTAHTEGTYLVSLQISMLLWRGRPPALTSLKATARVTAVVIDRVLVLQHEHH